MIRRHRRRFIKIGKSRPARWWELVPIAKDFFAADSRVMRVFPTLQALGTEILQHPRTYRFQLHTPRRRSPIDTLIHAPYYRIWQVSRGMCYARGFQADTLYYAWRHARSRSQLGSEWLTTQHPHPHAL